jgi:agmatinase
MTSLDFAQCKDYEGAQAVVFGVDTQCAGTAPTFVHEPNQKEFSADFIRQVDNQLFSLPENLKSGAQLFDKGNLELREHTLENEVAQVLAEYCSIIEDGKKVICLGGDHIIKYAALKALNTMFPKDFGVVYLDAHPDCAMQDTLSYSSILYHAFQLETLNPSQIMLVGTRQFTQEEANALLTYEADMGMIMGSSFSHNQLDFLVERIVAQFSGLKYLYFSIDLDGLSPSCAPAVESPYPGGPNLNQVLYLIHKLRKHFSYIGMDISEFMTKLDHNHTTALSAARIMKEFYSVLEVREK